MFDDMVSRDGAAAFRDFAKTLDGRKLRVATMCSGTEAPLLAVRDL